MSRSRGGLCEWAGGRRCDEYVTERIVWELRPGARPRDASIDRHPMDVCEEHAIIYTTEEAWTVHHPYRVVSRESLSPETRMRDGL